MTPASDAATFIASIMKNRLHKLARLPIFLGPIIVGHAPEWAQAQGSAFSSYVTLSSDFVYRGTSQTDESPALQLGIDYQHDSGFFAGGWISNVEYMTERFRDKPRDIEIDYYLGYTRSMNEWSLTATLARYFYPGISVSYDYTELTGRVGYRDRIYYTLSYTDHVLSHESSALGHELSIAWPIRWNAQLGAVLGRFDSADAGIGAFNYWNIGLSKPVRRFALDLRYHDTSSDLISPLGIPLHQSWVVSLSYQL